MKYPDFLSASEALSLELEIKQIVGDDPEKIGAVMDFLAAQYGRIMDLSYEIDGLEDQMNEASQVEGVLTETVEELEADLDDAREELREEREYIIRATSGILKDMDKISQKVSMISGGSLDKKSSDVVRDITVLKAMIILVKQDAEHKLSTDGTHGEITGA